MREKEKTGQRLAKRCSQEAKEAVHFYLRTHTQRSEP
jgi:hypothetical protein